MSREVYCKDCKWLRKSYGYYPRWCSSPDIRRIGIMSYVTGKAEYADPSDINDIGECKHYQRKWWKWWVKNV